MRSLALLALLLAACVTTRPAVPPGPPPSGGSPRDVPLAPASEVEAEELRRALGAVSFAQPRPGRDALEAFLAKHPGSPNRGIAAAALARLTLDAGDAGAALALLERHAPGADVPTARFVRGLIESRAGRPGPALASLTPFAAAGAPPMGAEQEEAELALRAALAEAHAGAGDVGGALAEWEKYLRLPGVREHERGFARARADELAARLKDPDAVRLWNTTPHDFARAAIGTRVAAALRAAGDPDGARRVESDASALRQALGWGAAAGSIGPGDPHRLGLLAPLTGAAALLGDVVLRGAMLAIGQNAAASSEPAPFQIVARDSAAGAQGGARAAFELVREEAVIAVVGVGDRRAAEGAVRDGVPVLLLHDQPPGAHSTAFQMLHAPEARAAELARRALAGGVRRFAVLAPDNPEGRRLGESFAAAVTAGGGKLVTQATYPPGANAFTAPVAELKRASFEAVFIPDEARRLELVAPALAAADLWPSPWGAAAPGPPLPGRRSVLLLSTAVGLGPGLLKNAGRYVQGALLAPGFYADRDDPRAGRFVSEYRTLYGQDPSATDAYGYDAFRLLASLVERGARSRAELLRALQTEAFEGATGAVRFGPDHGRADPPAVYQVSGDAIRALR
jgi:ABC-type branched-subunit amino acid transport system substrate-binding protein